MTLVWQAPLSTGACAVSGYYLMRDDGLSGEPTIEVNTANDPMVRNMPTLRTVDVELPETSLGRHFTFSLFAENREGQVKSLPVTYLFAAVP